MSKKTPPGVRIRMNRNGSMNIRSYGGVDLRKVLPPEIFAPVEPTSIVEDAAALTSEPGHDR